VITRIAIHNKAPFCAVVFSCTNTIGDRLFALNRLLDGLPERVTITFFAAFARFEYALMQGRFLKNPANNGRADVDWQKLANSLGGAFFEEAAVHVRTLINDPPKKLVVRNGAATFGPKPKPATNTHQLLQYARQVRNNLFHGKQDVCRRPNSDEQLMRRCLWLIELVYEKAP